MVESTGRDVTLKGLLPCDIAPDSNYQLKKSQDKHKLIIDTNQDNIKRLLDNVDTLTRQVEELNELTKLQQRRLVHLEEQNNCTDEDYKISELEKELELLKAKRGKKI